MIAAKAGEDLTSNLTAMTAQFNQITETLKDRTRHDREAVQAAFAAARASQHWRWGAMSCIALLCLRRLDRRGARRDPGRHGAAVAR